MVYNLPELKIISLIEIMKEKSISIAELVKRTGMKRATFIYYLQKIEALGLIKKQQILKGKRGRPTIIEFNHEAWEQKEKDFAEQLKQKQEIEFKEIVHNPLTKKVLKIIEDNPKLDMNGLLSHVDIKSHVLKFSIINWLHDFDFIKESFEITETGKKFLKTGNLVFKTIAEPKPKIKTIPVPEGIKVIDEETAAELEAKVKKNVIP